MGFFIPNFSYYLPKRLVIKYKNPFIHGSLIIKRTVLVNLGGYKENFYYSQDYKLFYDFINSNFKINILKEPLYFFPSTKLRTPSPCLISLNHSPM